LHHEDATCIKAAMGACGDTTPGALMGARTSAFSGQENEFFPGFERRPPMLLESYRLEIFNSACNPGAMSVHCFAHLDQDVGEALPYLNSVLGGFEYLQDPPSVTFKTQGKLITVHSRKIAVNALKDEEEARKIVEWLKREINAAWEERARIVPSYKGTPRPQLIEILKLLPKTNCRKCGEPTCMVFAVRMAEGAKTAEACTALDASHRLKVEGYMSRFMSFD
jgi:ArsR family metal-binding transcriptional regulator